jgi:hypothetical protein
MKRIFEGCSSASRLVIRRPLTEHVRGLAESFRQDRMRAAGALDVRWLARHKLAMGPEACG